MTQGIVVGGGEVILVMEQEPSVRAPICRALRQLGYFVLESQNPDDALLVLQDYHAPVHLVIADMSVPDVSGKELVDLLRSWFPQLKVLFVSAQEGQPETNKQPLPSGTRVLQKPFSGKRLTMMVRSLLDEGRRSSGTVSPLAQ